MNKLTDYKNQCTLSLFQAILGQLSYLNLSCTPSKIYSIYIFLDQKTDQAAGATLMNFHTILRSNAKCTHQQ